MISDTPTTHPMYCACLPHWNLPLNRSGDVNNPISSVDSSTLPRWSLSRRRSGRSSPDSADVSDKLVARPRDVLLSARALTCCAQSGGLTTPPRRHPGQVAILSTDAVVLCVFRFGLWGALPPKLSRCDSPQLSPLRLAVCLVVSGGLVEGLVLPRCSFPEPLCFFLFSQPLQEPSCSRRSTPHVAFLQLLTKSSARLPCMQPAALQFILFTSSCTSPHSREVDRLRLLSNSLPGFQLPCGRSR